MVGGKEGRGAGHQAEGEELEAQVLIVDVNSNQIQASLTPSLSPSDKKKQLSSVCGLDLVSIQNSRLV